MPSLLHREGFNGTITHASSLSFSLQEKVLSLELNWPRPILGVLRALSSLFYYMILWCLESFVVVVKTNGEKEGYEKVLTCDQNIFGPLLAFFPTIKQVWKNIHFRAKQGRKLNFPKGHKFATLVYFAWWLFSRVPQKMGAKRGRFNWEEPRSNLKTSNK